MKIADREFELKQPRGRNGRRATNYLITHVSGEGEQSVADLLELTEDDTFLDNHLPQFLSKEDAKFVDENATTGELLALVLEVVTGVFEAFQVPEMDAALKNSPGTSGEQEE